MKKVILFVVLSTLFCSTVFCQTTIDQQNMVQKTSKEQIKFIATQPACAISSDKRLP
ncbi:MAG: hypothetical protein U5L45_00165 [Saprospiraceae bacterium]|nr:hypothetical protein [Saprospiraceae bacterium]